MCFLDTDSLLLRIYNEDSVRDLLHLLDTAKVLLKLLPLFLQTDYFLLRKYIKCTILRHSLDLFESLNTSLDCLEVCQHTTEPSLVYIVHTATLCLSLDRILSLLLCTYKKNVTTVCNDILYCIVSCVYHSYRLLQIDNVDTITLCVNVLSHFRVPSSCLMSEVYTCFQ